LQFFKTFYDNVRFIIRIGFFDNEPPFENGRRRHMNRVFENRAGLWGLLLLLVACVSTVAQEMPPTVVLTQPVKKMDFHDQITLVGRTEAIVKSRIVAEVSGRVLSVIAPEGNLMRRGRPLIQIDTTRIALSYQAKKAEAAEARATANLLEGILERADDLYSQKLISELSIDSVRAMTIGAMERFKRLLAEEKNLGEDLADCTIRAPFEGYTGRQLTNAGEWVTPGVPVYEMVDLSRIKIVVDLPERYFGQVAVGSSAEISQTAGGGQPLSGRVIGISPAATEETHTFPVIVEVDNADGRLGSGMLVRASLFLNETFSSLAVSKDAIVRQGPQTLIYTIVEGKASPITVVTSSTNGIMIAVTGEGLVEGLPIVIEGNERIFPDSPVMDISAPQDDPTPEKTETETSSEK